MDLSRRSLLVGGGTLAVTGRRIHDVAARLSKAIDRDFRIKLVANSRLWIEAPFAALKLDGESIDSFALG